MPNRTTESGPGPTVPWYKTVNTEAVFEIMRRLDDQCLEAGRTYQRLAPRHGEIAVGGRHFDAFAEEEAIRLYLSALRGGKTPDDAKTEAREGIRLAVEKWNHNHMDVIVHRSLTFKDARIDHMHERVIFAAGRNDG